MNLQTEWVVRVCCVKSCGMQFAVPAQWDRMRRNDHASFYCPNGHGQSYMAESEAERIKRELDQANHNAQWNKERREAEQAAHQQTKHKLAATKGVVTRVKRRVGNGVCPCCDRSFGNLLAHMLTKHPEYHKDAFNDDP